MITHKAFMRYRSDNPPEFDGVAIMVGPDVRYSEDPAQDYNRVLIVTHSVLVLNAWAERQYDEDGEPYDRELGLYDRVLVSDGHGIVLRLSELHSEEWLMNFYLGGLYERGEFGWTDRYTEDNTLFARERHPSGGVDRGVLDGDITTPLCG